MADSRLFRTASLNQLPTDILLEIASYLSIEGGVRLQDTGDKALIAKMNNGLELKELYWSKISADILKGTSRTPRFKGHSRDVHRLAAILNLKRGKKHGHVLAELLFKKTEKVKVRDPAGRHIQQSLYQQVLATGDVWLLKEIHHIIFPLHPASVKAVQGMALQQIKEQFPNYHNPITLEAILLDEAAKNPKESNAISLVFSEEEKVFFTLEAPYYDDRNIQQIIAVKRALMAVVKAITADDCLNAEPNEKTWACIDILKASLAPKDDEIIKTGLHFPLFMLAMAADVYRAQDIAGNSIPPALGAWNNSNKCEEKWSVYSRLVLGLVQKYLTAVDGQSLKNGLRLKGCYSNYEREMCMISGPDRQDGLFIIGAKGRAPGSPAIADNLGNTAFMNFYGGLVAEINAEPKRFDYLDKTGEKGSCDGLGLLRMGTYYVSGGGPSLWKSYAKKKFKSYRAAMEQVEDMVKGSHYTRNSSEGCKIL